MIDLAGSERHESASAHSLERIREMKEINSSLSCLKVPCAARHAFRTDLLAHLLASCLASQSNSATQCN